MNLEKANNINFNDEFLVNETYPEITLTSLPKEILMLIKRVYSGSKSEFTSITQYSYNHFVFGANPKIENISNTMSDISRKEMEHYETLAKILVKCGIDPKNCVYIDGNPNVCDYWKASSVSYDKKIVEALEADIKLEEYAIDAYNEIVEETTEDNLKQIINRIILDEKSHIAYFKAVLNALME